MHQKLHLLIAFTYFSIGSSFKNTIVRRVPEDCSDSTHLTIDEIRINFAKNSTIHYVIYGNHSMFVKVDDITRDHFPVVRLQDQPKQIKPKMRGYLNKCQILDKYVFNEFSYRLKNESDVPFIGFNYLWLGCPQALCLSARIDSATILTNGSAYVFRGNYYWDLKFAPFVGRAHKIIEWNKDNIEDNGFNLGHFDAVVTNNDFTSFFRNNRQYIWDFGKINEFSIELQSNEFQFGMDSAFAVINSTQSVSYDIRGQMFVIDKNPFTRNNIKELGIPWDRVDAAFARNNTIYLFKDWYYLKLSENTSVPAQSKIVFKDIYNCPSSLYDQFGGYQLFLEKNIFIETQLDEIDDKNQTIVAIILILITISIIILVILKIQLFNVKILIKYMYC